MPSDAVRVFYVYAPADELLRIELEKHLSGLWQQGLITEFHDCQIMAGTDWASASDTHLVAAQVILLLVSPNFLASAYCYSSQMQRAIQRHREGYAHVIPVLLRPVYWEGTPFAGLTCLPQNAKPVTSWSNRDKAFLEITRGIRRVIEELRLSSSASSPRLNPPDERDRPSNERPGVPDQTTINAQPDSIFLFNEALDHSRSFFGRVRERMTLLRRSLRGASTSIIGPRRIGKTWLMSYLQLVAQIELGEHFRVGYLDATLESCATIPRFTSKALEELGLKPRSPDPTDLGLVALETGVRDLKKRNQFAVLCIDEFEGLCKQEKREVFTLDFFTALRAMTQAGLCLVVASQHPLIEIVGDGIKTSPFFNVFEQLKLKPFTLEEAQAFGQTKGTKAGFTKKEQEYLLKYGREQDLWPPLRLQLVGTMLLEDKTLAEREGPQYYRPNDPSYWQEFEQRLEEKYRGAVR